ncbi:hypothetical protein ACHAXS_006206 [Conticribra weissflogii]
MSDKSSLSSLSPHQQQQKIVSGNTANSISNRVPRRVDHTYHDYAYFRVDLLQPTDPDYVTFHGHGGNRKRTNNFPAKLHSVLSNSEYGHIVRWMPHDRAWKIINKDLLISEVIPKYWGQTKFESFMRQLSGWGFKRLHQSGPDFRAYYHECFLRGLPTLTKLMKRVESTKEGKLLPDPRGEPNFYNIQITHPLPDAAVPPPPPPHPSVAIDTLPPYPPPPQPQPMIHGHGESAAAYYHQPPFSYGITYSFEYNYEYTSRHHPHPPSHGYQNGTCFHGLQESDPFDYSQIHQAPPYQHDYSSHVDNNNYGYYQHPPSSQTHYHPSCNDHGGAAPVAVAAAAAGSIRESRVDCMQNPPYHLPHRHHPPTEPFRNHPPPPQPHPHYHHENYKNPSTFEQNGSTSPYQFAPFPPQFHHNYGPCQFQHQYQYQHSPLPMPKPETFGHGNANTNFHAGHMNVATNPNVNYGTPPPSSTPTHSSVNMLPRSTSTPPYQKQVEDQPHKGLDLDQDVAEAFDPRNH